MQAGIDVLEAGRFAALSGLRVGLITNQTGRDAAGRRTIDVLNTAPGVTLAALFSPEHGLEGDRDEPVESARDGATGLPVQSLYGKNLRPTDAMLQGLDALVFDIQDAGARFYTFAATMAYAMEAASAHGLAFFVLDRPNPITGTAVQGPVSEENLRSFTNYFPEPVRHGMTIGELAQMFNAEYGIGARLTIVPMRGYDRRAWHDQTGVAWVPPSPNLPSLAAATLYPALGLLEGANLSVGRGTPTPFEIVGAPWIGGARLASDLRARRLAGVRTTATRFTPVNGPYAHELCEGVRFQVTNRDALDLGELGIEIGAALQRRYPDRFKLDRIRSSVGAGWVVDAIRAGEDPRAIAARWRSGILTFLRVRARYLLYQIPSDGPNGPAGDAPARGRDPTRRS